MRFVVALCAAFLLFLGVGPAYAALVESAAYAYEQYSPGEQNGGPYDCPVDARTWLGNNFYKGQYRLGKSIFINGSGGWIAAVEDATLVTSLYRPDLAGVYKKGSIKNTSIYTYDGWGRTMFDDNSYCL